jgi:hypothetical protein
LATPRPTTANKRATRANGSAADVAWIALFESSMRRSLLGRLA